MRRHLPPMMSDEQLEELCEAHLTTLDEVRSKSFERAVCRHRRAVRDALRGLGFGHDQIDTMFWKYAGYSKRLTP